jgi:hypothetical protein
VECFKYHKTGHYANDCPQKKDDTTTRIAIHQHIACNGANMRI